MTALALLMASPAAPEVTRKFGRMTVSVDDTSARPGGLLVVRLSARRLPGVSYAILDGRRCPFFPTPAGLRALVPVPLHQMPGVTTLGVEVRASRRQRFSMPIDVLPHPYPDRRETIPDRKRAMLALPSAVRDGRLVQLKLRTVSGEQNWTSFRPPVAIAPVPSFGSVHTFGDGAVESKMDGIWGEHHRGLDYMVPSGTPVAAPASGYVLFAGPLTLTGETVVLDHGQGVVSVLFHLSEPRVREGDWVAAGALVGLSGESGIVEQPQLHWGLYVHGVAVDPRVGVRFPG